MPVANAFAMKGTDVAIVCNEIDSDTAEIKRMVESKVWKLLNNKNWDTILYSLLKQTSKP